MKRYIRYNIENLKPFTKENASYYGSRGGIASGKSRLRDKILTTKLHIGMIYLDLLPYQNRVRIYNKEYQNIKEQLHYYKIYQNRLNKLLDRYNKKYGIYRE